MTSDESTRQTTQDKDLWDFDAVTIRITINDEVKTGEEFCCWCMVTEDEIEASEVDVVGITARGTLDEMLHQYQSCRDGESDD